MDELGKDNNLPVKSGERAKPTLVTVEEGRKIILGGRWNDGLMADYVIGNGSDKWLTVGHLAKVGCGSNTIPNKKRVRNNLSSLFLELMNRGMFLAIEYGDDFKAASAVKIADLKSVEDRQNVETKLDGMKKRKELTSEKYDRAITLVRAMQPFNEEEKSA